MQVLEWFGEGVWSDGRLYVTVLGWCCVGAVVRCAVACCARCSAPVDMYLGTSLDPLPMHHLAEKHFALAASGAISVLWPIRHLYWWIAAHWAALANALRRYPLHLY